MKIVLGKTKGVSYAEICSKVLDFSSGIFARPSLENRGEQIIIHYKWNEEKEAYRIKEYYGEFVKTAQYSSLIDFDDLVARVYKYKRMAFYEKLVVTLE